MRLLWPAMEHEKVLEKWARALGKAYRWNPELIGGFRGVGSGDRPISTGCCSTFVSMIPALIMSMYSPLLSSYSNLNLSGVPYCEASVPTITLASSPALLRIVQVGCISAQQMMDTPRTWSRLTIGISFTSGLAAVFDVKGGLAAPGAEEMRESKALSSAMPPPGRLPSLTAVHVALSAVTKL